MQNKRGLGLRADLPHAEGRVLGRSHVAQVLDRTVDCEPDCRIGLGVEFGLFLSDLSLAVGFPDLDFGIGDEPSLDATGTASAPSFFGQAVRFDASQKRQHRVVVVLADRIKFMIVASGAAERESEEGRADGDHDVVGIIELGGFGIIGFIVPNMHSIEACGDDRISPLLGMGFEGPALNLGPFVPCELFENKPIVGFVMMESIDHVIAIAPRIWFQSIPFVAIRFRKAHPVEPIASPSFAIMMRIEQCVRELLPSFEGGLRLEVGNLLQRGWQSLQVEKESTNLFTRGGEIPNALHVAEAPCDQPINFSRRGEFLFVGGEFWISHRLERPELPILLGDFEDAISFFGAGGGLLGRLAWIDSAAIDPLLQ